MDLRRVAVVVGAAGITVSAVFGFGVWMKDDTRPDGSDVLSVGEPTRDVGADKRGDTQDDPVVVSDPNGLAAPLTRLEERVTKKRFGMFVTPMDSPVSPERFFGYHTGTDFEVFPEETDVSVAVRAVCTGELLVKRHADGYGGVVVQSCRHTDGPVTVVYGHLDLGSIGARIGENVERGSSLGFLGDGYGPETDGERKHLHISIRRGERPDIRGYVTREADLAGWIDPCALLCGRKH